MATAFVMVIFGATGDLARSKLIPALFSIFKQKLLPREFFIIGFARRDFTDASFAQLFGESTKDGDWGDFAKHLSYQQGKFEEKDGYLALIDKINSLDRKAGLCLTRFFYLATPPRNYEEILDHLKTSGLSQGCNHKDHWTRITIEKPFGKDLETARALDKRLSEIFEEKQIFRVDHYLGKETMQNMIAFRFANSVFEPVWNKNFIDHVQITLAETRGVGVHGDFFDGVGILRDVGQNHLMQVVAAVAMEQPMHFLREAVRDARAFAIKAIRPIKATEVGKFVVRGQYEGYREEEHIAKDSSTETFAAMKLFVDTDRFRNVPFYIRAGKKMPNDRVEINIVFIQTCHILFKEYGCPEEGNILTIRIQPDEGIGLRVIAKKPGDRLALDTVDMKFSYEGEFGKRGADAYEKLLLDIFVGDQMLFNRSDELESSWELITEILKGWQQEKPSFPNYLPATWGPKEASELIERDGRKWLEPYHAFCQI